MENKHILKSEQVIKISWEKIQKEMKEKFGKDIYESWLRKISFVNTGLHTMTGGRIKRIKKEKPPEMGVFYYSEII